MKAFIILTFFIAIGFIVSLANMKAQENSAEFSQGGSIIIGYDGGLCDTGIAGAVRYANAGAGGPDLHVCNGTEWVSMTSGASAGTGSGPNNTSGAFLGGAITVGWDNRNCIPSLEGALRYNSTGGSGGTPLLQFCDSSSWISTAP